MRKVIKQSLMFILALAFMLSIGLTLGANTVSAEVVQGKTPTFSETKTLRSTDDKYILVATGINDFEDVYEVGYNITKGGEAYAVNADVGNPERCEKDKYYSSITFNKGLENEVSYNSTDLFGESYNAIVVWEILYDKAVEFQFTAYAKVGVRDGEILYEADPVVTVNGTEKTRVANFTVTWKNIDGTVLETDKDVASGATPSYDGADPTYEDDRYTYTFSGWDKDIVAVTGDVVYTATYEKVSKFDIEAGYLATFDYADRAKYLSIIEDSASISNVEILETYEGKSGVLHFTYTGSNSTFTIGIPKTTDKGATFVFQETITGSVDGVSGFRKDADGSWENAWPTTFNATTSSWTYYYCEFIGSSENVTIGVQSSGSVTIDFYIAEIIAGDGSDAYAALADKLEAGQLASFDSEAYLYCNSISGDCLSNVEILPTYKGKSGVLHFTYTGATSTFTIGIPKTTDKGATFVFQEAITGSVDGVSGFRKDADGGWENGWPTTFNSNNSSWSYYYCEFIGSKDDITIGVQSSGTVTIDFYIAEIIAGDGSDAYAALADKLEAGQLASFDSEAYLYCNAISGDCLSNIEILPTYQGKSGVLHFTYTGTTSTFTIGIPKTTNKGAMFVFQEKITSGAIDGVSGFRKDADGGWENGWPTTFNTEKASWTYYYCEFIGSKDDITIGIQTSGTVTIDFYIAEIVAGDGSDAYVALAGKLGEGQLATFDSEAYLYCNAVQSESVGNVEILDEYTDKDGTAKTGVLHITWNVPEGVRSIVWVNLPKAMTNGATAVYAINVSDGTHTSHWGTGITAVDNSGGWGVMGLDETNTWSAVYQEAWADGRIGFSIESTTVCTVELYIAEVLDGNQAN